ncbi:helical backbone metal receptor [Streptomyces sp. NPDC005322]|uniref:helical backbone metal receptor n=1 Tax=Streptomyces sp. NPDC005322 TaxID=3157032 RepID=UPI0033B9C742
MPSRRLVLRVAGLEVMVTEVRMLEQAFTGLERVLVHGCGLARPGWLDEAEAAWAGVRATGRPGAPSYRSAGGRGRCLGRDTFAGDVLARLGVHQLYREHAERYPRIPIDELTAQGAELVVLPDEPYRFAADDGPEAFPGLPAALVSGRHLTWYGPSLAEAPAVLTAALSAAR